MKEPKGRICVIQSKDGHVMGHGSNFERCPAAGMKPDTRQQTLARQAATAAMLHNCASHEVAKAILDQGWWDCAEIVNTLVKKYGWRIIEMEVGEEVAP